MSLTPSDFRRCHHNVRHGFGRRRFRRKLKKHDQNLFPDNLLNLVSYKRCLKPGGSHQPRGISQTYFSLLLCVARSWPLRSSSQVDAEWLRESLNHRRSDMKKFLTTLAVLTAFATPAFAQSFDPDNGTRNVLAFGRAPAPAAPQNGKTAVRQNGVHSFAMVPAPSSA